MDGRVKDPNAVLATDDVFAAASKRMPSIYTALAFARIDRLVEKLMPLADKDANESADQLAAIRQIRSLCGATSFDGGKIRDTIFVGMPKLLDAGNLTRASLPIATKDTFLYAAWLLESDKTGAAAGFAGRPRMDGWFAENHQRPFVERRNSGGLEQRLRVGIELDRRLAGERSLAFASLPRFP